MDWIVVIGFLRGLEGWLGRMLWECGVVFSVCFLFVLGFVIVVCLFVWMYVCLVFLVLGLLYWYWNRCGVWCCCDIVWVGMMCICVCGKWKWIICVDVECCVGFDVRIIWWCFKDWLLVYILCSRWCFVVLVLLLWFCFVINWRLCDGVVVGYCVNFFVLEFCDRVVCVFFGWEVWVMF